MTDEDGHRIEAALQFGADYDNSRGRGYRYTFTEAQLIAFAMACERAGTARVATILRAMVDRKLPAASVAGAVSVIADQLDKAIAAYDAELAPLLEAERNKPAAPVSADRAEFDRLVEEGLAECAAISEISTVRLGVPERKPNPACGND